jgi:hypothetical protein
MNNNSSSKFDRFLPSNCVKPRYVLMGGKLYRNIWIVWAWLYIVKKINGAKS